MENGEDERIRAEVRAKSREIARSLIIDLHQTLLKIPGTTEARELLLHRSSSFVDSLAAASRGDRALQLELAETYRKIAQAWRHAAAEAPNNRREAIENQTKGLKLARAALQDRGYRSQAAAVTIRLLTNYRDTLREAGDLEAAKAASAELTRLRAEVNSEEADASRR
ncbi:MAG: hypothetical protein LC114_22140 [Bryobacterales bacterium]|nr:hypothetical protein [Bryobacterales bacterium]